ncbi:MAG: caspase family protein [Pseudomonadota bacterium]
MSRVGLCVALLGILPAVALAEQRALLVGVGHYATPGIDLPGIDLDLERMRETLQRMGFKDSQIRTLTDNDATSTKVIASFEGWLRQGVQPNDRVVFYFSGHGSNIPDEDGDESDHVDEVLVTHDMKRARVNGKASLTGVISDDKMATMISGNPSRNIFIVVDSCHSGTVTRSFRLKSRSLGTDEVYKKSFTYDGMPEEGTSAFSRDVSKAAQSNFVSLTAAGDGEQAIGTSKGGVFTIGLTEAITRLAGQHKEITVSELRDEAAKYIKAKVDKDLVHTPQINGNTSLAEGKLQIVPVPSAAAALAALPGPNYRRLSDLVAAQSRKLNVTSARNRYAVDEAVTFTVDVPGNGFLNMVSVDADDNATVVFPNRHQESNAVTAGKFTLPTTQMGFELLAAEPLGATQVMAFFSSDPINFFQEALDERDQNGKVTVDFPSLSHTATRAIRVAPRRKETAAGQLALEIVAAPAKP